MFLQVLFLVSGVAIALVLFTKVRELQTGNTPFLLRVISLGDARMKDLSHRTAHIYTDKREELVFFLEKQLPLHTRNAFNKAKLILEEKIRILIDDIRGHRFMKKNEGITEFFKSIEEEKQDSQIEENRVE